MPAASETAGDPPDADAWQLPGNSHSLTQDGDLRVVLGQVNGSAYAVQFPHSDEQPVTFATAAVQVQRCGPSPAMTAAEQPWQDDLYSSSDGSACGGGGTESGDNSDGGAGDPLGDFAIEPVFPPGGGKAIAQVAGGFNHSIALASDSTVHTWGGGFNGRLGTGNTSDQNVPVDITGNGSLDGKAVTRIAASWQHTVALASDGTVHTWGGGFNGRLGTGNTSNQNVPVDITGNGSLDGKAVTRIAVGEQHTVAVASDGTVHAWGSGSSGRLGTGNTDAQLEPVEITGNGSLDGRTVTHIDAGSAHTVAVASDGTVHAWGSGSSGRLGTGSTDAQLEPVEITGNGSLDGRTVTHLAAGAGHTVALASDGTVHTWGWNGLLGGGGQLGTGGTSNELEPVIISGSGSLNGKTIVQVSAGDSHSLGLADDGTVHAWGSGSFGQLGTGDTGKRLQPVAITTSGSLGGKTVMKVAASGADHNFALADDGSLHAWGNGSSGQLGTGDTDTQLEPVEITGNGSLGGDPGP